MRRKLGKVSYLLATVLVVGLIGGVAVADGKVGSRRIKANAVKSRHIMDRTIVQRDLRASLVESFSRPGADGEDGFSGYEVIGRSADAGDGEGDTRVTATAACANDKAAISGGLNSDGEAALLESYPTDVVEVTDPENRPPTDPSGIWHATSWTVEFTAPVGVSVQPWVICAEATF